MFDDRLLAEFATTFYGYGNHAGNWWFVGMEEGGGNSVDEINRRLQAWNEGGRRELEDLAAFHNRIGLTTYFTSNPRLQTTWSKLIRVVLSQHEAELDKENVRNYQRDRLGREDGETCLLELLPLPSPSTRQWLYGEYSELVELTTRDQYLRHYVPQRAAHIHQLVQVHRPRWVIFYGFQYLSHWEKIAQIDWHEESLADRRLLRGTDGSTTFVVVAHPAATGIGNAYFHELGRNLLG